MAIHFIEDKCPYKKAMSSFRRKFDYLFIPLFCCVNKIQHNPAFIAQVSLL